MAHSPGWRFWCWHCGREVPGLLSPCLCGIRPAWVSSKQPTTENLIEYVTDTNTWLP